MSDRLSQLKQGKYKNTIFFVKRETVDQVGQKRVIHDYPNSGTRYVESKGKAPPQITIEIFFHGSDWVQQYFRFAKLIEDQSPGRLISPTFGIMDNMVTLPATATAEQTAVGEIKMTVTFSVTADKPAPVTGGTASTITVQDISALAENSRQALGGMYSSSFSAPTDAINIDVSISDFTTLADIINKIVRNQRATDNFIRQVKRNIQNPEGMAKLLFNPVDPVGLLQVIATMPLTDTFSVFKQLATVGNTLPTQISLIESAIVPELPGTARNDVQKNGTVNTVIPLWDDSTVDREIRNLNRETTVNTFRMLGLIGMLEAAARGAFDTSDQVSSVISDIDLYYSALVENSTSTVVIPSFKPIIDRLRNNVVEFLSVSARRLPNVLQTEVLSPVSVKTLTYNLYGERIRNESELNTIASIIENLNKDKPAHRLQGVVNILGVTK
jgi:prophage DNA circulation protein